jgi:N-acetylglutamate synthase
MHRMKIDYRQMTIADYDAMVALWQNAPGIGLSSADERGSIAYFLQHNPGLSFIALDGVRLVGTSLAGNDGRRGYLHHVVVAEQYRGQGIGAALVERSLEALRAEGIQKVHLFVMKDNEFGQRFWRGHGWRERVELVMFSKNI